MNKFLNNPADTQARTCYMEYGRVTVKEDTLCTQIREVELKPGEVLISSGVGKLFEVSLCVIVVCSHSDLRGVQAYCIEIRRQLFAKTVRNCCFLLLLIFYYTVLMLLL